MSTWKEYIKKFINMMRNILSGSFLKNERVRHQFLFFLFLAILGLIYIANGHYAEKMERQIIHSEKELKEIRIQLIAAQSQLSDSTQRSYLEQKLAGRKIVESVGSIKKIIVNEDEI